MVMLNVPAALLLAHTDEYCLFAFVFDKMSCMI
jgi:hypothetical protein